MEFNGKKGYGDCANVKVDIEVLESSMEPENLEVSLRYVLKYSTRGGRNIFQLFETSERREKPRCGLPAWEELLAVDERGLLV